MWSQILKKKKNLNIALNVLYKVILKLSKISFKIFFVKSIFEAKLSIFLLSILRHILKQFFLNFMFLNFYANLQEGTQKAIKNQTPV